MWAQEHPAGEPFRDVRTELHVQGRRVDFGQNTIARAIAETGTSSDVIPITHPDGCLGLLLLVYQARSCTCYTSCTS
jgi:hypothetical protein